MDVMYDVYWVELHPDLLDEIVKHVNYGDYSRLRAVCKRWSLDLPKNPKHVKNPWLILRFNNQNEIARPHLNFGENRVYRLNLPETQKTIFCGSYDEWVVTLAIDGAFRILNPFARVQFDLPPLTTFPDVIDYIPDRHGGEYTLLDLKVPKEDYDIGKYLMHTSHIWKIIISAPPNHHDQDFVAMAICGEYHRLAWCRIGDSRWMDVPRAEITCDYEDAIFHEGKMYVVDRKAQIFEFDMKTGLGGISAVSAPPNLCLDNSGDHVIVSIWLGLLMVF